MLQELCIPVMTGLTGRGLSLYEAQYLAAALVLGFVLLCTLAGCQVVRAEPAVCRPARDGDCGTVPAGACGTLPTGAGHAGSTRALLHE